jgi:peptide chain release factor 1
VVFEIEISEERAGLKVFRAVGAGAAELFRDEPGGHRWQRIPPNERHGRVHTSTITVAVLREPEKAEVVISDRDLSWSVCRGTGPGGQKRNKTESTVLVTHRPTGMQVRCETARSQQQNRVTALALLRARLWALAQGRVTSERAGDRRRQVGSGMRGDKRRTIRCQDGVVTDHVTGRRWGLKEYLRGEW